MKGASTGTSANGGASKEIYDDRWGKTEGSIFNMQQAAKLLQRQRNLWDINVASRSSLNVYQ